MILFDAIHVNNGGAKVLLDLLIVELDKRNDNILFLLDDRIRKNHPLIKLNKVKYLKSGFFSRLLFYFFKGYRYKIIFSFSNLPPYFKYNRQVSYTYFHQDLFLNLNISWKNFNGISIFFKSKIIQIFKRNSDYWIVQSGLMSSKLSSRFSIPKDSILIYPFFRNMYKKLDIDKEKGKFIYISNASLHKNHEFLINAFCLFYDRYNYGNLYLTISNKHENIYSLVNNKKSLGYPIYNLGELSYEDVVFHLSSSEFTIYPSLSESFGLGLIESIECGSKIVASNLPYVFEVCIPSYTFNLKSEESLISAFHMCMVGKLPNSQILVENKFHNLIQIFKHE